MEFVIWIAAQAALCIFIIWFVKRRQDKAVGIVNKKKPVVRSHEDNRELNELRELRARALNVPLSEIARPSCMEEIQGQEEGIRALRVAMCGANPQHVIIYGPPGIGKTCAARLVLEEAKKRPDSPFDERSKFVEMDATCVRFDERSIADPLIGSVHDPIYQGAGALGAQGVPQPKPGAVTRAHCGILFLDEIGELHPTQMNKLLKVLEDRRVFFESAYYSKDNAAIPPYIHDIFAHGLPADFRLVGATTRSPDDIPPALRSRCIEIYFRALDENELSEIAFGAAKRLSFELEARASRLCASYSASGREVVNIVQLAAGNAATEGRHEIVADDVEWVAKVCRCIKRQHFHMPSEAKAGVSIGLGVSGAGQGMTIELECSVRRTERGNGRLSLGGMVEQEEFKLGSRTLLRRGTARISAENACESFRNRFGLDCLDYDISFNVPGGMPLDGPSAGIAFAVALMSAITCKPMLPFVAMTGEITPYGEVKPVGGVPDKLAAAVEAGARTVIIPAANWEKGFAKLNADIICVQDITEVMRTSFGIPAGENYLDGIIPLTASPLSRG